MHLEIDRCSLKCGETLTVTASDVPHLLFDQMQVDIITAGTPNAEFSFGKGTFVACSPDGCYSLTVETDQLKAGYYEVCVVRLRKSSINNNGNQPEHEVSWLRQPKTQRICFEVTLTSRVIAPEVVLAEIEELDKKIEYEFLEPVCAVLGTTRASGNIFTVFVFVRHLLIGARMRFPHYEIVSVKDGLEVNDELHSINEFLRKNTKVQAVLKYSDEVARQSRQANPVCVFHYPTVLAQESAQASAYATEQTLPTLLALSLSRGASGEIFGIVVVEHGGGVVSYAPPPRYVGNLLTGSLTGENVTQVGSLTQHLKRNVFDRFLVALYKEALRETSVDFQYVRFWQILEVLAETRNYDEKLPLLGYKGEPMMDGGKPINLKSSPSIVFALLRDSEIGNTVQTWKAVNAWFALRSAAAHHGAIAKYQLLSRPRIREWAEQAHAEISTSGHDHYLWELKEDTKLLLMRKLNSSTPWS